MSLLAGQRGAHGVRDKDNVHDGVYGDDVGDADAE